MSRAREIASRNAGTIGGSSIVNTSGAITTTGALAGATLTTTGNIVMGDDTSIGIADDAERIEFDGAGDISVLGANLGVGTDAPTATTSSYKVYSGTANTVDGMTLAVASDGAVNTRSEIGFGKQVAGSYSPSSISYVTDDATGFSKGHFEFALRDATTDSAATKHLHIDSDGDVKVTTGNLTADAAGKGIGFGSEIMDDYEEFTWNPDVRTGSYNHFSITYTTKGVKIGRLVHMDIYGQFTATSGGGQDGLYFYSSLPYPTDPSSGDPRKIIGLGWGGYDYGVMHNLYGNVLNGTTAQIPAHSTGDVINFAANLTYYTAS